MFEFEGDFHDDVYIYVNRDFKKVDEVHYKFGAIIDSTMRMILGSVQQVLQELNRLQSDGHQYSSMKY